jgi:putative ABC transport system permease protein
MHINLQGDIFLIGSRSNAIPEMQSFSQRRLYQALSFEGVESVSPLYIGHAQWRSIQNHANSHEIYVFGFNPANHVINLPGVQQSLNKITIPDVVLFDEASRSEFGDVVKEFKQGKKISTEVAARRVTVGGLYKLGTSFIVNGSLITSDLNFLRLFPGRNLELIDVGIIKLKQGVDTQTVLEKLRLYLPKDVKVLSKQEYMDMEKSYWNTNTPVGYIFALGTVIGFIVGTVIVYQILYSDVLDHLAEYATLKAMGYRDIYLLVVVFQESLILAILGFIPGFTISMCLYQVARGATLLPLFMQTGRTLLVLGLTILMCCISGSIAMQKLNSADPADIF